jgi:hypothetical protein
LGTAGLAASRARTGAGKRVLPRPFLFGLSVFGRGGFWHGYAQASLGRGARPSGQMSLWSVCVVALAPPGVAALFPSSGPWAREAGQQCGRRWAGSRERKGTWWMPWRQEATKDVARCDKPRGAASGLRSGDLRMGQPTRACAGTAARIDRAAGRTRGTETSQYPEERTSTESSGPRAGGRDSVSSGERTRTRPAAEGSEPEPAGTPGQSG